MLRPSRARAAWEWGLSALHPSRFHTLDYISPHASDTGHPSTEVVVLVSGICAYNRMINRSLLPSVRPWAGVKKSIATWAKGKGLEYCRNLQAGRRCDLDALLPALTMRRCDMKLQHLHMFCSLAPAESHAIRPKFHHTCSAGRRFKGEAFVLDHCSGHPRSRNAFRIFQKASGIQGRRYRKARTSCLQPVIVKLAKDKLILSKARDALGLDQCKSLIVGGPIAFWMLRGSSSSAVPTHVFFRGFCEESLVVKC